MNGVDRSDQMLACHKVIRKCRRWWKVLFFHLIDIAVVNGFILFQQHRSCEPDNPALQCRSTYTKVDFREEIVRQLCGLAEYDRPPVYEAVQADTTGQFCAAHVPELAEGHVKRQCVVCYAAGRGQQQVRTYCSAPQCNNKFMHVFGEYGCFWEWHSDGYAGKRQWVVLLWYFGSTKIKSVKQMKFVSYFSHYDYSSLLTYTAFFNHIFFIIYDTFMYIQCNCFIKN